LLGFRHGGETEFAAWLRAVTRNLCIDYLRGQKGRRRLPVAVTRLPELDRLVFEQVYWEGRSASEAFEELSTSRTDLSFSEVLDSLERLQQILRPWQLEQIANPSARRPHAASEQVLTNVPNGRPNPEATAELKQELVLLEEALDQLPPADRLLLRLRFEQGLTLQQVASALRLGDHRKAHQRLAATLARLREILMERGWI
jgi:RNA polymerase sigma factor (sigma-70 family)